MIFGIASFCCCLISVENAFIFLAVPKKDKKNKTYQKLIRSCIFNKIFILSFMKRKFYKEINKIHLNHTRQMLYWIASKFLLSLITQSVFILFWNSVLNWHNLIFFKNQWSSFLKKFTNYSVCSLKNYFPVFTSTINSLTMSFEGEGPITDFLLYDKRQDIHYLIFFSFPSSLYQVHIHTW